MRLEQLRDEAAAATAQQTGPAGDPVKAPLAQA